MRSWRKFTLIPLLIWLFWSAMLWSFDIQNLTYSYYDAAIHILAFIPLIAMPYAMLKYAPQHEYIATLIYMLAFKGLLILIMAQFNFGQFQISNLYSSLIFSTIAMLIYAFKHHPKLMADSVS